MASDWADTLWAPDAWPHTLHMQHTSNMAATLLRKENHCKAAQTHSVCMNVSADAFFW